VNDKDGKEYEDSEIFRFNVEQGLQDIEIEEWKRMEEMDAMARTIVTSEQCRADRAVCQALISSSTFS